MGSRISSQPFSRDEDVTCSNTSLDTLLRKARTAESVGHHAVGVLISPGSFNPVYREHVHVLQRARAHLEDQGLVVVAGFLQPWSDEYLSNKVDDGQAMSLKDRILTCDLASEAPHAWHNWEPWLSSWRSGENNAVTVAQQVEQYLNGALKSHHPDSSIRIVAHMVCGADLVLRCGGWSRPASPYKIVITRDESDLQSPPATSVKIREAIGNGDWQTLQEFGCERSVVNFLRSQDSAGALFRGESQRLKDS